jgi:isocitrate dehydrogenase (NAD+)
MKKKDIVNVTLIPGDGIGPEVTDAAVKVMNSTGVKINWEKVPAGASCIKKYKTVIPEITFDSIKKNKVALKGPVSTPIGKGFRSVNVTIRKTLNLFANFRPVKSSLGLSKKFENIDLVVVRENTEDLYAGLADFAFRYAKRRKRKKITVLHKANIMKLSDGLFISSVAQVAKNYSTINYEEMIIDNACMQLVLNPNQFDVILTENLYGDIVSEICAALVGGLGFAPGANIGKDSAVFEAAHGSAPDIAGKNVANPIAVILSGAILFRFIGYLKQASMIEKSVEKVIKKGEYLTRDIGGNAKTTQIRDAIIDEIDNLKK